MCSDDDVAVASLAALSLTAVFKDILPGYRIRLPTEKELQMPVSKEVRELRDFEAALLRAYQVKLATLTAFRIQNFEFRISQTPWSCQSFTFPEG